MMDDAPVCLITGASGGLASGVARRLNEDGYRLILMSRSGCVELAEDLGQAGFAGSVLSDQDMDDAVAFGVERFGRVDCAVFSGGRQGDLLKGFDIPKPPAAGPDTFVYDSDYKRDLFDIPFEAWHKNYEMNVLGPMRLFKSMLPQFLVNGRGALVAMSGIEALQPRLPYPLGPNRLALHGFVKLLSDRHGPDNIRINCIAPGLMENAASEFPDGWLSQVPMGRHGKVSEIAGTVAFLLSDDAGYITGQTIVADGGVNRTEGL